MHWLLQTHATALLRYSFAIQLGLKLSQYGEFYHVSLTMLKLFAVLWLDLSMLLPTEGQRILSPAKRLALYITHAIKELKLVNDSNVVHIFEN